MEEGLQADQEDDRMDAASDSGGTNTNSSNRTTPMGSSTSHSTSRASIFNDLKSGFDAGLETSKTSLRSSIEFITAQIQTAKEHYNSVVAQKKVSNSLEPREIYPRMPWHDVQASVTGLVARDCAAHFVQVSALLLHE